METKRHYLATITRKSDGSRYRVCGHYASAAAFGVVIDSDPDAGSRIIRESLDCDAPTPDRQ